MEEWPCIGFSLCSLSGYRYLGDGGTDRREISHDDTYRSRTGFLPFEGGAPRGSPDPESEILAIPCEYLENGKSQRDMSIRA